MEADLARFTQQLTEFVTETEKSITDVFQQIVIKVGESVIYLSPVLTGRFRGNWQMTEGTPSNFSLIRYDPDGASTLSEIVSRAANLSAGEVAYIVNNLTYGALIETGNHSLQAPNGVIRVTEARFTEIVNDALMKYRRGV